MDRVGWYWCSTAIFPGVPLGKDPHVRFGCIGPALFIHYLERGFINVNQRTGPDRISMQSICRSISHCTAIFMAQPHMVAQLISTSIRANPFAWRKNGRASSSLDTKMCATTPATYASRAGASIEIVSKVILRHANLSMTQRYLGKVSDDEASRWDDTFFSRWIWNRGSFYCAPVFHIKIGMIHWAGGRITAGLIAVILQVHQIRNGVLSPLYQPKNEFSYSPTRKHCTSCPSTSLGMSVTKTDENISGFKFLVLMIVCTFLFFSRGFL